MSKTVQKLDTEVLRIHPWQKNIPDMKGNDWDEFLEDVRENGIQHPITVSTRTGEHVIVDGHQRVRAAQEVELKQIDAIAKSFQDEISEITFIVGANKRRQLSDAEKSDIADALRAELEQEAAERIGGRPKKPPHICGEVSDEELPKPPTSSKEHESATIAANKVDLSREKYRKTRVIKESAPESVQEAWREGKLSTNAAHKLTLAAKTDSELYEALENGEITSLKAIESLKTKEKVKKEGIGDAQENTKEKKEETEPQEEAEEPIQEDTQEIEEPEEIEIDTQGEPEEPTDEPERLGEATEDREYSELKEELTKRDKRIKELELELDNNKQSYLIDMNEHSKEIQELRKQLNQSEQARKVLVKHNEDIEAKLKKAQLEATGFRNQILEMQGWKDKQPQIVKDETTGLITDMEL